MAVGTAVSSPVCTAFTACLYTYLEKYAASNAAIPPILNTQAMLSEFVESPSSNLQKMLLPRDTIIWGIQMATLCRPSMVPAGKGEYSLLSQLFDI